MSRDPIVDEVRAIRAAFAQEHGNNLKTIIAALKRREGADGRHVVSLAPSETATTPAKRKAARGPRRRSQIAAAVAVTRRHV